MYYYTNEARLSLDKSKASFDSDTLFDSHECDHMTAKDAAFSDEVEVETENDWKKKQARTR